MPGVDVSPFGMFLRPTGKGLATRYGARRPVGYAGRTEEGRIVIDPDVVIALPHLEAQRYRREYRRQIAEGALVEVKAKDYQKFVEASHEAEVKAAKAAEATAKKDEAAAKKADAEIIEANAEALKQFRAKKAADAKAAAAAEKKRTGSTEKQSGKKPTTPE